MAITIELYKKMTAYFDGKLTLEEEKAFLELVESDPELKKEFEWEEAMLFNAVPNYKEELNIASDGGIQEIEIPDYATKPKSDFIRAIAMAASFIIAISLLTNLITRWSNPVKENDIVINDSIENKTNYPDSNATNPKTKYTQNYLATVKLKKERVNNLGRHKPDLLAESPLLGEVQVAYVKKEYSNTIKLSDNITQLRGADPDSANIKAYAAFYKGIAYLEMDKDSLAIIRLNNVIANYKQFPVLVQHAQWNLCKAFYKTGKNGDAHKLLQQLLSRPGFIFKKEGVELLDMIKKD